jgi:hypothetical protein
MTSRWRNRIGQAVALALTALTTCRPAPVEQAKLQQWVKDPSHGLFHEIVEPPARIQCEYRPPDLLAGLDLQSSQATATAERVDSLRQLYKGHACFVLTLSVGNSEIENQFLPDRQAFAEAVRYLNSGLAGDVVLITSSHDSSQATTSMYVPNYGLSGGSTVVLNFALPAEADDHDWALSLHGQRLNLGDYRFRYHKADRNACPRLASAK